MGKIVQTRYMTTSKTPKLLPPKDPEAWTFPRDQTNFTKSSIPGPPTLEYKYRCMHCNPEGVSRNTLADLEPEFRTACNHCQSTGWIPSRRLACSETSKPTNRRRMKSRAELLAERFARHLASVARD